MQSRSVVAPSAVTAFGVIDGFNATAVNGWIWPISVYRTAT
jgi:hypothetical protein